MRSCCVLAMMVVAGCRFDPGKGASDAATDGTVTPIDTQDGQVASTCYERWLDGTIRFGPPTALAELNSDAYDRDPWLTADELALYFSSVRGGQADIWVAKRTSKTSPFSTPTEASEFNSTAFESKLSFSADHKVAVVGSDRLGGAGGIDVWEAIRINTAMPWPAMNRFNVMQVSSTGNDQDPMITSDAQRIYFAPDTPSPQHIAMVTRSGSGSFGPPSPLAQLNTTAGEADPAPTLDERIIAFTSNRPQAGAGNGDLYYATRAATSVPFDAPQPIPDLNTAGAEGDPHISTDGCRIYFVKHIAANNWDLYVASAL